MDAIEQGFLQAIREGPLDRTTRLVYADWLDDRDDPRGDFLREEAELMTLPPCEARSRELQARLGHVVMAFDSEWVADVSLLGRELFQVWGDLEKSFEPAFRHQQSDVRADRCVQWQQTVSGLGDLFTRRFPALSSKDRFRVPIDYTLFCSLIGAGWSPKNPAVTELILLSIDGFHSLSICWLECIREQRTDMSGLWLTIGLRWSTQGEYHLCCDRLHPAFGSVYESVEYSSPWTLGVEGMDLLAPSFLDFLRTIPP